MSNLNDILKTYWGYDSFRFPQEEIIRTSVAHQDTIALLATGAGKSVCFQVSGLAMDGLCLVISPLIALMDDQVNRLKSMGITAEAIHSGRSMNDVDRILNNAYYGKLKFVYLSPERLESDILQERLLDLNISLVAIDEAHCISQWGFDFRPSYLKIGEIRNKLKNTVFMALTATASPQVLDDIKTHLNLDKPTIFKTSFLRENISLNVILSTEKKKELLRIVSRIRGSGIIYVRSRYQCENLAKALSNNGVSVMYYHAGLNNKRRAEIQRNWQIGKYRVVVATNAFGMGIDKADVRFVVHYDTPDKPEEYYQEVGRGGRDGLPATAVMLYSEEDISKLDRFMHERFPTIEEIKLLYHRISVYLQVAVGSGLEQVFDFDFDFFCDKYGYKPNFVKNGIKTIEHAGWIEYINVNSNSSSLKIIIENRALRAAIKNHPVAQTIINNMLRMYEGIFFEKVDINEEHIARLSKIDSKEVIRILKALHRREWIEYDQHLVENQIFFLHDRPADINFAIDKKHYEYLKRMSIERLKAIKNYIHSDICRQKNLLSYFDEYLKSDCGVCDVCRGTNLTEFSDEDKQQSLKFLKEKLSEKPISIQELIYLWPYNKRKRITRLVNILENEKHIIINRGMVTWNL